MGHGPHHSWKKSSHDAARIHKSVPTRLVPANRPGLILEVNLVPFNTKELRMGKEKGEKNREQEWERTVAFPDVEGYSH